VAVLDFFLSLESRKSQLSTDFNQRFYYLTQDVILNLTGQLEEDQALLQQTFAIIDERTASVPFLFLVASQNNYFLVMFDFIKEKVLILGHCGLSGPDFHIARGEWGSWKGRALWRKIHAALNLPQAGYGAPEQEIEPTIYETDFILVYNSTLLIYRANLPFFLDKFSFRPWYFGICAASPGWQMELEQVFILDNA